LQVFRDGIVKTKQVRLDDKIIKDTLIIFARCFLTQDELWLFGSRVDLTKKG